MIADYGGLWRRQKRKLVDGLLSPQFLKDSDPHVGKNDHHKHKVLIRTHKQDTSSQKKIKQIEKRKDVGKNNLPNRFRRRIHGTIGIPVFHPFLYLSVCQASPRVRLNALYG